MRNQQGASGIRLDLKGSNNSFWRGKVLKFSPMKRLFGALFIIFIVLVLGAILLIYSQGKRIDRDGHISGSGILQIGTTPNNAKILLDGKYRAQSDTNIENLKKGIYTLRIEKDHYTTWEKSIEIKDGLITSLKITLFPTNPSLTAITFDGIYSPKVSTDNKRVLFGIQTTEKAGLWVLDLTDPQLFFDNRLHQVVSDTSTVQFSKSSFFWTADNKSIFLEAQAVGSTETKSFLLKSDQLNKNPTELGQNALSEKERQLAALTKQNTEKLTKLGKEAVDLGKDSVSLTFSKDNKAVIITKLDQTLIYDSKPTLAVNTKPQTLSLPKDATYSFLHDPENHLIAVEGNTLNILDRDGTNKVGLFTGDFDPKAIFSWPNGAKVIISINLNSKQNPLPNLYSLNLEQ